ncbi:MAG: amino acid ABC transporter substrate-binding protein [Microcoleus vaginatus WJT46-NPBG5]|nr:amino acid ABC transporter substrate-binding protein [Microcoleus vaginatus WJT46-NPBG5]
MRRWGSLLLATMLLVMPLVACRSRQSQQTTSSQTTRQSRLDTVLKRGKLICGVGADLPGFSYVGQDGKYVGLDVDVCRAVAAALFDNPDALEIRPLTPKERFTAMQSGEVDLLSRNTTWTLGRDTEVGMEFAPTVFYDGQAMMVRKDSGIKSLEDLKGKAVCVQTGTTTENSLADQMRKRGITYQPLVFEETDATFAAYAQGRCQGVTTDRSQLAGRRSILPDPDNHILLDVVMSKEPLAPLVLGGDTKWFDVVKWSVFALFNAEELEITSQNVTQIASTTTDPVVRRFLGVEGNLGKGMGVSNEFAIRIIKHVGNYSEVYDRNLGPKTPLNLPRGINNLWTKGGLLYSPPFL